MKPAVEKRLKELCEELRAANPRTFFFHDEGGVHLRDYKAGRDFLIYGTVCTSADTIVDCHYGDGKYPSFPIPWEGPVAPAPFNVGDVVKDKITGKTYRVRTLDMVDSRRHGMDPYWRAAGTSLDNEWEWREQATEKWIKEVA